jgi:hypothetical protein
VLGDPAQQVPPRRFERPTNGLGNRCSIQLSYGGKAFKSRQLHEVPSTLKPGNRLDRRPRQPFATVEKVQLE